MVSSLFFVGLLLLSLGLASGQLPSSFAFITDSAGVVCGGAFLDPAYVVTSTACAITLDPSTTFIPTSLGTVLKIGSFSANMNGLTLLQLTCPGVTTALASAAPISFATISSEALEEGSCFPTGTLGTNTGNEIFGITVDGAGNLGTAALTFVPNAQCQVISNIGDVTGDNCFEYSGGNMILSGSPAYIQTNDSNSRDTILGLADSNTNNTLFPNVEAYNRVSTSRSSLGNFIFDASTGNSLNQDQLIRRERQDMLRQRIQAGQTSGSSSSTTDEAAVLSTRVSRAIKAQQKRDAFLNQVRDWHVTEDGLRSSFNVEELQDAIDSHFSKRAPASAFVCPVVVPGCLPATI